MKAEPDHTSQSRPDSDPARCPAPEQQPLETLGVTQYNRRSWHRRLPAVLISSLLISPGAPGGGYLARRRAVTRPVTAGLRASGGCAGDGWLLADPALARQQLGIVDRAACRAADRIVR